jgi:hypothetical protein
LDIKMDEFKIQIKAYLGKEGQFVDLVTDAMQV